MRSDIVTKFLYLGSYLFLGLPYLVFFWGWLRQPYSTIFVLILLVGILAGIRTSFGRMQESPDMKSRLSMRTIALILLTVSPVALIAGAGGWGFQDTDWLKHNAILRDLITASWPVIYEVDGHRVMLTYYTAYQLPAAAAGKVLGWQAANHLLFAYTAIGFFLSALWVWVLTGAGRWWVTVIFLAFSGLDVVGQIIAAVVREASLAAAASWLAEHFGSLKHVEWWSGWGFAQFSSMASLMVWVPNQGISGWLLTSLILFDGKLDCLRKTGLLYLGLSTLWSPFVSIGLLPFVITIAVYRWRERRDVGPFLREPVSLPNFAGIALALLVAIYLAGRFQDYELPMETGDVYQEGITLTFLRIPELFLARYLCFILLEFALLHGLLYWYMSNRHGPPFDALRRLLIVSSVVLVALPILNWGWNNEPAMRSSIPALFVTVLVTIYILCDEASSPRMRRIKYALIALLITGSLTAVNELGRHVAGVYARSALVHIPDRKTEVRMLFEIQEQRYRAYYSFASQYLGSAESFFARYLAQRQGRRDGTLGAGGAPTAE